MARTPGKILQDAITKASSVEVAGELNCSVTTLYKLINGSHPSLDVANLARDKFGIPTDAWGTSEDRKTASK